ncbi:armadillo-type protein [Paraphysoderma sedebokerense]|nr:armadillo-type protein [Paraphysoderma sedebokerense]KAI9140045.1 armadillo-type protein [Paraphysoderma sedebokerense]
MSDSFNLDDWEKALEIPPEILGDDVKGLHELKISNRLNKTREEIERYSVDESLDDIARAIFLLRNGANVQKLSIISNLGKLHAEYPKQTSDKIVPELLDILPLQSTAEDVKVNAGKGLMDLIKSRKYCAESALNCMIAQIKKLLDNDSEAIRETFCDLYITLIENGISVDLIRKEIIPEALIEGGLAQPSKNRLWCCRILGASSKRLDEETIQKIYLRKALSLCQDTDYEVRACMCEQLNLIAKRIGPQLIKEHFVCEYLELTADEEDTVRQAALINLVNLLDRLDAETKRKTIIPLWTRLCTEKSTSTVATVAKTFGQFLVNCNDVMEDEDIEFFIEFYQWMSVSEEEQLREFCAYNFPAVLQAFTPSSFETTTLSTIFQDLSKDSAPIVRQKIASGFHEVARMLASNSYKLLKPVFWQFFQDDNLEVFSVLSDHLNDTLVNFMNDDSAKKTTELDDILFLILRKERILASNSSWRAHHKLLLQFSNFSEYFDSDSIYNQLIPLLTKLLMDNVVVPIRETATKILLLFLKKLKKLEQRDRVCKSLAQDICHASSYKTRMIFLNICKNVIELFSNKFFKQYFFHEFLLLGQDPVVNVRIRLSSMLVDVRRTIKLPADDDLVRRFEAMIKRLHTDKNRDIKENLRQYESQMQKLLKEPSGDFLIDTLANIDKEKEMEETRNIEPEIDDSVSLTARSVDFSKRVGMEKDLRGKRAVNVTSSKKLGAVKRTTEREKTSISSGSGANSVQISSTGKTGSGPLYSSNSTNSSSTPLKPVTTGNPLYPLSSSPFSGGAIQKRRSSASASFSTIRTSRQSSVPSSTMRGSKVDPDSQLPTNPEIVYITTTSSSPHYTATITSQNSTSQVPSSSQKGFRSDSQSSINSSHSPSYSSTKPTATPRRASTGVGVGGHTFMNASSKLAPIGGATKSGSSK